MGSISTRQKPARRAYAVRVSGRMSVPVEAEGLSAVPTGKQPTMLNPYSSCSRYDRPEKPDRCRRKPVKSIHARHSFRGCQLPGVIPPRTPARSIIQYLRNPTKIARSHCPRVGEFPENRGQPAYRASPVAPQLPAESPGASTARIQLIPSSCIWSAVRNCDERVSALNCENSFSSSNL